VKEFKSLRISTKGFLLCSLKLLVTYEASTALKVIFKERNLQK